MDPSLPDERHAAYSDETRAGLALAPGPLEIPVTLGCRTLSCPREHPERRMAPGLLVSRSGWSERMFSWREPRYRALDDEGARKSEERHFVARVEGNIRDRTRDDRRHRTAMRAARDRAVEADPTVFERARVDDHDVILAVGEHVVSVAQRRFACAFDGNA